MLKIKTVRKQYKSSNSKLRRARRLYIYQIFNKLDIVNKAFIMHVAIKMISHGLYAESTSNLKAYFSVCSYVHKYFTKYDWHRFMDKFRLWPRNNPWGKGYRKGKI